MLFQRTWQDVRPYRPFLVAFVLVVTIVSLLWSVTAKPTYVTSLAMTVNRINRQETPDYQFDGYYAIQASDLFSQTLLSWFLTPSTLLEFYTHAGLDPKIASVGELVGRFRARKFSAQNIVVQFSEANRSDAERLASAIGAVVEQRGEALNTSASGDALFEILPASPVIVETKPNVTLVTVAAFIASLLLGVVVVASLRYLRS